MSQMSNALINLHLLRGSDFRQVQKLNLYKDWADWQELSGIKGRVGLPAHISYINHGVITNQKGGQSLLWDGCRFTLNRFIRIAWTLVESAAPQTSEADEFIWYFKSTWLDGHFSLRTWNYFNHDGPRKIMLKAGIIALKNGTEGTS